MFFFFKEPGQCIRGGGQPVFLKKQLVAVVFIVDQTIETTNVRGKNKIVCGGQFLKVVLSLFYFDRKTRLRLRPP